MARLNIESQEPDAQGRVPVLVRGALDIAGAADLDDVLDGLDGAPALLDLRGVEFIDSSGLALLLERTARAREAGCRLEVLPGREVTSVLDLARVDGELDLVDA